MEGLKLKMSNQTQTPYQLKLKNIIWSSSKSTVEGMTQLSEILMSLMTTEQLEEAVSSLQDDDSIEDSSYYEY